MPSSSGPHKKNTPFAPSSKKEWTETAKLELGGPIEKLTQTIDGIDIFPYYDQADRVEGLNQLTSSQNEFLEPRAWSNLPRILTNDPLANEKALLMLNRGADGIIFDLMGDPDPATLLRNIELPYCQVVFAANTGHEKFFQDFYDWIELKGFEHNSLTGAIFWKTLPSYPKGLIERLKSLTQFHSLGVVADHNLSPTEEIAALLAKAVIQIDSGLQEGAKSEDLFSSLAFSVSTGTDFFLDLAKLKALRLLWPLVENAYGAPVREMFLHATTADWKNPVYEPHGNLLKATTAGMSAVLGGCSALTIDGGDPSNPMESRVALNVSSILREESHFGKVADATAGSYYVDRLSDQIAVLAWQKFQKRVSL